MILRLKDKDDRHGTTAISLQEATAADDPQTFSSRLSHRTWYRGEMTGEVLVRVAGGQEDVEQLDEDSVVRLPWATQAWLRLFFSALALFRPRRFVVSSCAHPQSAFG